METGYLGGICHPANRQPRDETPTVYDSNRWHSGNLSVSAAGSCCHLYAWESLALVIRGSLSSGPQTRAGQLDRSAAEIRAHYLENRELPIERLEGSFSIALLDAEAGRVVLYRNFVGAGFTYYHPSASGLWFGSNLTRLVDAVGGKPRVNRQALPAFFVSRFVPGRETLFDGVFRLLPGEQLTWDADGLDRVQRQSFASFQGEPITEADAVRGLEATMNDVLGDYAVRCPQAVNLLSGGVDSSYLQVVWNRLTVRPNDLPETFSISVDHPRTWPDTDYAVTASALLGTRHQLVPADAPYVSYLLDLIATTGEPPNHVQSAYFGHLADTLTAAGKPAALCGEGADSLFGLGLANQVHNARLARSLVPSRFLRQSAAVLARLGKCNRVSDTLWLADHLSSFADAAHPINRAAVFTDWPALEACFGGRAVVQAQTARRNLLDHFDVPGEPMDRLHAIGYLTEAIDSASLWTTLFNRAGADLFCPFLDSRLIRFVVNLAPAARFRFRRPKALLKAALVRNGAGALAHRSKLGFGQPIFEWLAPGGQLRPLVEQIGDHDFVDQRALQSSLACPNWFLYSLLCYDLWHKLFIERSLPRTPGLVTAREVALPVVAALR